MREFKRGQIWLVNFDPSFGYEYKKTRPALIIQQYKYIPIFQLLVIIPISSKVAKPTELDILLRKDSQNRLMKDSLLKTKQISSFDKRRFIKLIGIVNEETMENIDKNIQFFLFGSKKKEADKKGEKVRTEKLKDTDMKND